MSDVATLPKTAGKQEVKPMEVTIVGKALRVRRYEQFFYTAIITPAADLYSKPQVIEIRSKARFCEKDEEVRVTAKIGGYEGKPYSVTDKETGERRQLVPVNLYLDALEG